MREKICSDNYEPCCCIKFDAQIHPTFGYQGMLSVGLIKWRRLQETIKILEPDFL